MSVERRAAFKPCVAIYTNKACIYAMNMFKVTSCFSFRHTLNVTHFTYKWHGFMFVTETRFLGFYPGWLVFYWTDCLLFQWKWRGSLFAGVGEMPIQTHITGIACTTCFAYESFFHTMDVLQMLTCRTMVVSLVMTDWTLMWVHNLTGFVTLHVWYRFSNIWS